ncbi:MAG: septum formation initiator family protein [Candidatus Hydrogenedentes bacterium]|nr:septum formation initiator family protein [Candidatus Hydrogenedentota bacterium]
MFPKGAVWYGLTLLSVSVLAVAYAQARDLYGRYLGHQDRQTEVRALEDQVRQLERHQAELQQRAQQLRNDDIEMEAAVRRTKKLVRPGEKIYRIVEAPDPAATRGEPR